MSDQERIEAKLRLETQFGNGVSWFYWIAGLTLINEIVSLLNGSWGFVSGLGVTQLISSIAYGIMDYFGVGVVYYALFINLLIISIFFVLGKLAYQKVKWAIIVGIVLYGMDTLTFLFITDYLSIGFHALAIYCIFKALKASEKLNQLEQMEQLASIDEEIVTENN